MNLSGQPRRLAPLIILVILIALCAPSVADEPAGMVADAAERQDARSLEQLLKQGAAVDAAQPDGMTAVHWATWYDDATMLEQLLTAGANAEAANRYGVRPLLLACENGSDACVRLLLDAGADPNTRAAGDVTALMLAARTGRITVVRRLIGAGAEVDAKQRRGQTALMWAAAEGHADVIQALIDAGADFRKRLPSGFTPLLLAAREGQRRVVDVLLAAGENVNQVIQAEHSGGRAPRVGMSPLLMAVENGHFQLAVDLLEAGADANDQRSGYTPLHAISWVRKPNFGDGLDGQPPPIGSGRVTSLELVRQLVAHGADINARLKRGRGGRGRLNRKGSTPFLFACDTADLPLMRLLLELGADPTVPNADNSTPLMAAAGLGTMAPNEEAGTEEEMLQAVTLLLELGADVNAVDDHGETAMHGAAYNNAPRVVALLARRGADPKIWNRPNEYGWTPLKIAQGHRVGNFKPSPHTVAAIEQALRPSER